LKGIKISETEIQGILDKLLEWNGYLDPSSVGATIYEPTRYFLVRNLLESALSEELTTLFMGEAFHPLLYSTHDFYGHDTVVLLRLLKDPEKSWWIKQAGGRDILLIESLLDASRFLRKKLGNNMGNWQWGKIHRAVFPHAMALRKPLDKVFNRGNLPIGGDTDTLCQTAVLPSNRKDLSFELNAWGPGHRQIINMENLEKSLMISVPGQSGHLGSPHYDDSIDLWINGEYHPMLWTREKIEANAEGTLKLEPEN
jgi:penicillin amidase